MAGGSLPNRSGLETRLLFELGRGGMGIVYLAVSEGPGGFTKLKVVKRLRAELAGEPRARQMFLDEAKLAARLLHPNIVQTNDVGFDGANYFIEMEYLEGQSFEALVRRAAVAGSPVPLADALWILTQTLAGLHHAHELTSLDGKPLHIVHRDVSPHNVFLTYDGAVKVLDFGIAKAVDSQDETTTGAIKGKVTYLAPEQAARQPVDRRADIFAAGIMLWQVLTGRRIWEGLGDFEIFTRLHAGAFPAPSSVRPDVPPELEAICLRAMAKEPAERFATAAELQAALESYLESIGALSGPKSIAKIMSDLFSEVRASLRGQIEARIKEAPVPTIEVPAIRATISGGAVRSLPDAPTRTAADARAARRDRTLQRGAIAAATVALIAGAAFAFVRLRPGSHAAASPAAGAAAVAKGECAHHADCVKLHGEGWICRPDSHACAALASDQCKVLAEPADVDDDRTIWFGTMYPTTGPKAEAGTVAERGADLGRRDFSQITHGIPELSWNAPARPVGLVACNDADDPERVARHLAEEVRVSAVLGFGSSQEVVDLATRVFIPRHVMVVATQNQSPLITAIASPPGERRLVFRTTLSSAVYQTPVSLIVPQVIEPQLRKGGAVRADAPMKVALVRSGSTADLGTADQLFAYLRFNDMTALENGERYRQFVFRDLDHTEDVVAGVLAFRPHVIIFTGQGELTKPIFEPIEKGWTGKSTYRPFFVGTNSLVGDELLAFVGGSAERRHRFFGVAPPATTMANARLTMRYNEVFPQQPISAAASPAASYDAFYLVAYAAVAAKSTSGPELAAAVERLLPPGEPVDVGPIGIVRAVDELRRAGRFDLGGIMTRMDFDLATGEPKGDLVITCFGLDEKGQATDGVDSGLRYDSKSNTLVGALRCP